MFFVFKNSTFSGKTQISLHGVCVFEDDPVNELIGKAAEADGFVFGSPVYYAHANGRVLSVLDRAFYAGGSAFTHKPGAAVVWVLPTLLAFLNKFRTYIY